MKTKIRMTRRQLDQLDESVLSYIQSYQLSEGFSPSRAEIAARLNLPSIMSAQRSVERLQQKHQLEFSKHSKRELQIQPTTSHFSPTSHMSSSSFVATSEEGLSTGRSSDASTIELPFLGHVAAGKPIEVIEQAQTIEVPKYLIQSYARTKSSPSSLSGTSTSLNSHFVLKVVGDSMIDDHICDGDLIIVRKQSTAHNGERVIALVDHEATLKRFYQKSTHVELHPANSRLSPIIIEPHQHLRIAGVYVGLIRVWS